MHLHGVVERRRCGFGEDHDSDTTPMSTAELHSQAEPIDGIDIYGPVEEVLQRRNMTTYYNNPTEMGSIDSSQHCPSCNEQTFVAPSVTAETLA